MSIEHLAVLIIGAGLSGIGVARAVRSGLPAARFAVLEARGASGGTWDLFRYPGVRSDSEMQAYGFDWKPWRDEQSLAEGSRILSYLREAATEAGLDQHIRFHHRVIGAAWSSVDARWLVDVERSDTGERMRISTTWLFCASGYYRYDRGHTPAFPGRERFAGPVVHPQSWPEHLDLAGRRVVVIGSGATAVTMVPAIAATARHVTMLQRTPTYVLPLPRRDPLARVLLRVVGRRLAHRVVRRLAIARARQVWRLSRRYPVAARRAIRWVNARLLPRGYPVDEHFNPPYDPWDQRLCAAPDGDLFRAIRQGRASVVTDRIESFTERGIRLASGGELEADVVVTATGLDVQVFGGLRLEVDGAAIRWSETVVFKGMMLSGVPNFAFAIGSTNLPWTPRVELVAGHLCRLLTFMAGCGWDSCRPQPSDPGMPTRPWLDFGAGYVRRAADQLPRQGDRGPWRASTDLRTDVRWLRGEVADPALRFGRSGGMVPRSPSVERRPAG
jgi:monooxygenase